MCDLYVWPNAELLFLASMLYDHTKHAWLLCKKKAYSDTKLWTPGSKNIKFFLQHCGATRAEFQTCHNFHVSLNLQLNANPNFY